MKYLKTYNEKLSLSLSDEDEEIEIMCQIQDILQEIEDSGFYLKISSGEIYIDKGIKSTDTFIIKGELLECLLRLKEFFNDNRYNISEFTATVGIKNIKITNIDVNGANYLYYDGSDSKLTLPINSIHIKYSNKWYLKSFNENLSDDDMGFDIKNILIDLEDEDGLHVLVSPLRRKIIINKLPDNQIFSINSNLIESLLRLFDYFEKNALEYTIDIRLGGHPTKDIRYSDDSDVNIVDDFLNKKSKYMKSSIKRIKINYWF